jgi:hypothetical protein
MMVRANDKGDVMAASKTKKTEEPKTFALHWGKGIIEEEVQIASTYHRPTIQLLKFTEGAATGTREIRFCHYDHHGRFQRSPLIIDEAAIPELRKALKESPKLAKILKKLVAD